ncbi:U3 small nucleolar ribonucleoprotein MPP10 [Melia azedarach]|uniref:U3 small nucleolar ribonucleoprotein MPP10 n=1 Tax=Melia azedarach TaxID=155640 RepID=A0ACC1XN61_MELAZ|nr:U3 small nucleolar ribonucleoprotein MPP10 [Melia azedarach]
MATKSQASLDLDALQRLKSTKPPVWLVPRTDLSETARTASKQLFSLSLCCPASREKLRNLRRIRRTFGKIREVIEGEKTVLEGESKPLEEEIDDVDEELDDGFGDDDDEEEEEEGKQEEEEGRESEEEDNGEEKKGKGGEGGGIEDEFLKINELQEYLEEDEAREYGLKKDTKRNKRKGGEKVLDDDEEDEDEDEEDEDEDEELGVFDDEDDEDEDIQPLENAKYQDFFGSKNKKLPKKKLKSIDESEEDSGSADEDDLGFGDEEDDDEAVENQKNDNLSTHEKQLKKLQSEIEMMEKANLDPKTWTMQGEVTAAQRPKNSALEVDLDFQHNIRPAPVITEEFTASLEEMIKKRIVEGQFDDVQKLPSLPSKAPRELKELDENKSKKGLAEVYEEEYVQKTNPAAAPLSFSDEQKKEASMLFKKLCLKLDALSHFHFTPKPVIEDMSIQANVPALAMEEIAPIAVSDAAMLAPEEVFAGKGDVKEEAELTQAERKRRRANKKRRFKAGATKRMAAKKARENTLLNHTDGKEE